MADNSISPGKTRFEVTAALSGFHISPPKLSTLTANWGVALLQRGSFGQEGATNLVYQSSYKSPSTSASSRFKPPASYRPARWNGPKPAGYFTGGLQDVASEDQGFATLTSIMAGVPPSRPTVVVSGAPSQGLEPNADPPGREDARLNMLRKIRPPPLKYAWTMYHDKHGEGTNYEGRLTLLLENIINVKHFWAALNHFPMDHLRMKDSVHFFKRGVRPVWEDPRNVDGGSWTFRVPKDKSVTFFHEVLMLCVGEQFADVIQRKDDLCGCSLSTRFNSNLITIWNRDGTNKKSIDGIVQIVLDRISPELRPKESSFYYKKHSEHAGFDEAIQKARDSNILPPKESDDPKVDPAEVRQEEVEQDERDEARKLEEASKIGLKVPKHEGGPEPEGQDEDSS